MASSSASIDQSKIEDLRISTDEEVTVGIELGGSYSSIGIWHLLKQKYELIYKCRSCVSFEDGVELVGEELSLETITQNTILGVTSFLGRKSSDISKDEHFPYKMVEGPLLRPVLSVKRNGHYYMLTSEELTAIILRNLKLKVETRLQRSVNRVVICIPSCFGTLQRQATLDAAAIAGLDVVSLIDDTTSIGVSYFTLKNPMCNTRLIIAHMGFLAFDISVVDYKLGRMRVVLKCSEESLGLHKYVSKVMMFCVDNMGRTPTVDELIKLRIESERAIFRLASSPVTKIDINDTSVMLTRENLHRLLVDLVESTETYVRCFLYEGNVHPGSGTMECNFVLSGAMLTLLGIGEKLKACFDGKGAYDADINLSDFVTRGAAVHAAYYCKCEGFWSFELMDVTHQDISDVPNRKGGRFQTKLIPKGSVLPVKAKKTLCFQASENPCAFIFSLYEGPKNIESKYSFQFAQGFQSISICLEINKNRVLKVFAEDQLFKNTTVSVMANYRPLSTQDILLFIEKAKRLDPELHEVGKYKMNIVLDASKDASLATDGAKALSSYNKMVDNIIQTQTQKIQEGIERALAHLNKMNIYDSILALGGQAALPTILLGDVEAVQVSGGTDGLGSELQKLQNQRSLNNELLARIEKQIQEEAEEDEQVISQSGLRQSIPQSSTLAKRIQDRLTGLAAKLKQAADSDGKIECSVRDHMALMSILDSRPIESALPTLARPIMSLDANEDAIVGALKQSLKELETLGPQREDLEAKLKDIKRQDNILPQLMTMTGSYEDLFRKEMLKYDHICEEISQNLHAQDELLPKIQAQNSLFASTFNIQDYMVSLEKCYKKIQLAIAKYREIRESINKGLNFYATLEQEIRNLKQHMVTRRQMVPCSNSPVFEEDTDSPKSDTIDSVDAPRAPIPLTSNSRDPNCLLELDLDVPKGSTN